MGSLYFCKLSQTLTNIQIGKSYGIKRVTVKVFSKRSIKWAFGQTATKTHITEARHIFLLSM